MYLSVSHSSICVTELSCWFLLCRAWLSFMAQLLIHRCESLGGEGQCSPCVQADKSQYSDSAISLRDVPDHWCFENQWNDQVFWHINCESLLLKDIFHLSWQAVIQVSGKSSPCLTFPGAAFSHTRGSSGETSSGALSLTSSTMTWTWACDSLSERRPGMTGRAQVTTLSPSAG